MDPSILLETFSAEDMDIWQSYNLFVDENLSSSSTGSGQSNLSKDHIKEENNGKWFQCLTWQALLLKFSLLKLRCLKNLKYFKII